MLLYVFSYTIFLHDSQTKKKKIARPKAFSYTIFLHDSQTPLPFIIIII